MAVIVDRVMEHSSSILLVFVLLLFSAFFSGSETALFSLQHLDRERLKDTGRSGQAVTRLLADPRRTLASVLMGNELINISLSAVCAGLVIAFAPDKAWLNLLVATPLLLLFGEVLPKSVALRDAPRFASIIARPLTLWASLIAPVRWLLSNAADLALRLFGARPDENERPLEEEQVRRLIKEGHDAGTIRTSEHLLIQRVLNFGDIKVARLMTPRPDIQSLSLSTPYPEMLAAIRQSGFSRIPIYQGSSDQLIGILLTKDLLRFRDRTPPTPRELKALLQPPYFVPASKDADEMLQEFRRMSRHLALVVDEHGSIAGLITLDDLLSELMGSDFTDDEDTAEISHLEPGLWTVSGSMDIEDFHSEVGLELPPGEYHTLAGFVLAELGHVPRKGEELVFDGVSYTVVGMEGPRITELAVQVHSAEEPA